MILFLDNFILLKILKNLDPKDRLPLRLVSKRFKFIVDSIRLNTFKSKSLILFSRRPPIVNRFKLIDGDYSLEDIVYLINLTPFFKNPLVLNCIDKIEKLVIYGNEKDSFNINYTFDHLNYLELHNAKCTNSTILKSKNLEYLYVYRSVFNHTTEEEIGVDLETAKSPSFYFFGFNDLKSKQLKSLYLRDCHNDMLGIEFFKLALKKSVLPKIKELDVHLQDFNTLHYILDHFTSLKRVNVLIKENLNEFCKHFHEINVEIVYSMMLKDVDIYIYGLLFKVDTSILAIRFCGRFRDHLQMEMSDFVLAIDKKTDALIESSTIDRNFLTDFFKIIRIVLFNNKFANKNECKKMINAENLTYYFLEDRGADEFVEFLKLFPNMHQLKLISEIGNEARNDYLDLLPIYCKKLSSFSINTTNAIKLDFLFEIKILKTFILNLDQAIILDLIRSQQYLTYFEIYFPVSNLDRQQLSAFKKLVNHCLSVEMKRKDCELKIEIRSKVKQIFVKYILKRSQFMTYLLDYGWERKSG